MLGQKIWTLTDEEKEAGYHTIRWDGRDDNGERVSSGVYLYGLKAKDFVHLKKMIILK